MGRRHDPDEEPWPDEWADPLRGRRPTLEEEIRETDWRHRRQYDEFRLAADYVAVSLSRLPIVEKVALFGSVARPLFKEVPRHRRQRRARAEVPGFWLLDSDFLCSTASSIFRSTTNSSSSRWWLSAAWQAGGP